MANKTINMTKLRQIFRYYSEGKSKLQISSYSNTSRNTVKRYIRKFQELNLKAEEVNKMTDHELEQYFTEKELPQKDDKKFEALHKYLPEVEKQLKRKGSTILKAWETYKKKYPDGYEHTQFYKHFQSYCKGSNTTMHMHHQAGDKVYIDFAGAKLEIVDTDTGEAIKVEVFVAILGCSQLIYVEAVYSQKKEDLIKACENALLYFGGVQQAIVPDNLKSAVTKSSKYEPIINETFADFAEHYSIVVLPARAYRPRDKSLVEGAVKIIYRRIYLPLQDKIFTSLSELNAAVRIELELLNDAPFKGRNYSRRQQFEELKRIHSSPFLVFYTN